MLVEGPVARLTRYGASVDDGLAVVIAVGLQPGQPEQPVGRREEADRCDPFRDRRVTDGDGAVLDQARVDEADAAG
jgi:hypothetical protein